MLVRVAPSACHTLSRAMRPGARASSPERVFRDAPAALRRARERARGRRARSGPRGLRASSPRPALGFSRVRGDPRRHTSRPGVRVSPSPASRAIVRRGASAEPLRASMVPAEAGPLFLRDRVGRPEDRLLFAEILFVREATLRPRRAGGVLLHRQRSRRRAVRERHRFDVGDERRERHARVAGVRRAQVLRAKPAERDGRSKSAEARPPRVPQRRAGARGLRRAASARRVARRPKNRARAAKETAAVTCNVTRWFEERG